MKSSFFFGIDGTILLFWLIFVVGGFVCTAKVVFVYTEREVECVFDDFRETQLSSMSV